MDNIENITITKKDLCNRLGCNSKTLRKWLMKIPNLDYEFIKGQKFIPPKYIKIILNHLE